MQVKTKKKSKLQMTENFRWLNRKTLFSAASTNHIIFSLATKFGVTTKSMHIWSTETSALAGKMCPVR